MFLIDDEICYLSEMNEYSIANVGWLSRTLKKIVLVVGLPFTSVCPAVAIVAGAIYAGIKLTELTYGTINYNNNKNLRVTDQFKDGYIYGQSKMSSWRFGAKTLDYNGCGIIATYNTLKILNKNPDLTRIILDFDYRSGSLCLGFFGSDPSHISEYLFLNGIYVKTVFNFDSIEKTLGNNQIAIVCQLNNINKITDGVHYYIIHKKNNTYYTYNRSNYDSSVGKKSTFRDTFDPESRLIVGYII